MRLADVMDGLFSSRFNCLESCAAGTALNSESAMTHAEKVYIQP